ncbi:MAG TPA: alpha/beta hydrolase [Rhizomicrobium sp.]
MSGPVALRAAIGAPDPATWIDAGGVRLAVMRRGSGIPVLCLHAIGHGARDFEDFAARVGKDYEIIALDWPGQGRSPPMTDAPSAKRYADIALTAMDALGLDKIVLLGNSIGGAAALQIAARAPERVKAVVLCNSGGLSAVTPFTKFIIARMVAFFRAGERGKKWFAGAFRFYYGRMVLPYGGAQRDRIIAAGYEIAGVLRAAWEGFALAEADTRTLAPQITCPVWLAWAKSDQIIAWPRVKQAAATFPDHRVSMFRGGHSAFLEDPENFANGFRAFMLEVK